EYRFHGESPLKGGIYLFVISPSKYYDFVVSGDEPAFSFEADTANFVGTVKFKGSKENDILFGYRRFLQDMNKKAESLSKDAASSPEDKRTKMNGLQDEVNAYMDKVATEHKNTFASQVVAANREIQIPKEIPLNADGTKDSTFAFRYYKAHFWDNINFADGRILRTPFLQTKLE